MRRIVETVESEEIETQDRTIVVAVGGGRMGGLVKQAVALARAQSVATGIPYRQIVVFHMTKSVRREYVYRVTGDSLRPAEIQGNAARVFTEMAEAAPEDLRMYLALVPNRTGGSDKLRAALESLMGFHEAHGFKGHIVMVGDYAVNDDQKQQLQDALTGSTLVWVPI